MSNEIQSVAFIDAVYRRRYLGNELERLFNSIDDLVENLDLESRRALLINLRIYLQKLAVELEETEEEVAEALPSMQYLLDALRCPSPTPSDAAQLETSQPDSPPPVEDFLDTDPVDSGDEIFDTTALPSTADDDAYRDSWEAPQAPVETRKVALTDKIGDNPESWDMNDAVGPEEQKREAASDDIESSFEDNELAPSTDDAAALEPPTDPEDELPYIDEDQLTLEGIGEETLSPLFEAVDGAVTLDDPDRDDTEGGEDTLRQRREVLSILDEVDTEVDIPISPRQTHLGMVQMAKPIPPATEENEDAPLPEDAV